MLGTPGELETCQVGTTPPSDLAMDELLAALPETIDRSAEPRLFAFVDRLCAAQGAPAPRQIRVDTDVNASAALRHGLISLFRDDLTLTIGLPLARAMTLRELTGVLAHEFGHFG